MHVTSRVRLVFQDFSSSMLLGAERRTSELCSTPPSTSGRHRRKLSSKVICIAPVLCNMVFMMEKKLCFYEIINIFHNKDRLKVVQLI